MTQFLYFLAAVILFTAGAIVWTIARQRRRTAQLRHAAVRLGFSFQGNARLPEPVIQFATLFFMAASTRHSEFRNLMTRGELNLCDYNYWTGTGSGNRFEHNQTVACFRLQRAGPSFTLHPAHSARETQLLKMGLGLFAKLPHSPVLDVMLSSLDDSGLPFPDSRYRLLARGDEAGVRALFPPNVVEFLLARPPIYVESSGEWCVIYRRNILVKPEKLADFVTEGENLVKLLYQ